MKTPSSLAFSLLFGLALPASADTFILKDGTTLEGRILSDEGENYVLEVQVTPTIKDERTIPKSEIEKIQAEKLDEKAFAALAGLLPTPDLLGADDYDRRIRQVNQFLKEHPRSPRAKEAKEMLDTLQKEASAVAAGGMKLQNRIVPVEEYRANAFEYDARAAEARIREQIAQSQLLAALRGFEQFMNDYQSSAAFQELLPTIRQAIDRYEAQASNALDGYEARMQERKVGLERMSPDSRSVTQAALDEEAAAVEARYQEERSARVRWVTVNPYHKQSLQDAVRNAQQEARRLDNLRPQGKVEGGEAYRNAWKAIHAEEPDKQEINTAMNAVREARLPQRYVTMLEDARKAAEEGAAG